jgi:hypothetical protein
VDYAARVLGWMIRTGAEGVFHIANPQPVTQTQLSELAAGTTGNNVVGTLAGRRVHRSLDLFKCSHVRFDMARTSQALTGSGIEFPAITSDYLHRCLHHAESTKP